MFREIPVVIVAAMEKQSRAIGYQNQLLWHIPDDLKRFKELTLGHPVIMGRKTFESILAILGTPLPGRTNIVLTHDADYRHKKVQVVHTLEDALMTAREEKPTEIHLGGGAAIYEQAMPYVDRMHITFIDDPEAQADTFFPDFSDQFMISQVFPEATYNGLTYQWVDFRRLN